MHVRLILASLVLVLAPMAPAGIINGDFETGDLTGWTAYTTSTGTDGAGYPAVLLFDVTGSGASYAAAFHAGLDSSPQGWSYQGGGLYQTVVLPAGSVTVSFDWAEYQPSATIKNYSAGRFELMLDGAVIAVKPDQEVEFQQVLRGTLSGTAVLPVAGSHEIRVEVTRPYIVSPNTPLQYLDNISIASAGGGGGNSTIPEPGSWVSMCCGLGFLLASRRLNRHP